MLHTPLPLRGLRVLIVEDEPLVAVMLEEFVRDLGCRFVLTASRTASALETVETVIPDIVILDITLDGNEPDFRIADALAARGILFMFASGYWPNVVPERHRHRPFLAKPFGIDQLAEALCRV